MKFRFACGRLVIMPVMSDAIYNDVFGRLEWDARAGCWRGRIDWYAGRQLAVAIVHPDTDVIAGLRTALDSLSWLRSEEADARHCVAVAMQAVYNDDWREDDELLTAEALASRLELIGVSFGADGSLLLSYECGDLFSGHGLDAEFGPDRLLREAYLVD